MPDPDTISADYTLRPSELAATLALLVEARQPVVLWGAPGSAKSAVAQQVAADAARQYVDVRALLLDPVDLRGIPWRDSADRTRWAPPAFLPPTDDPGRWLINLEELPSAVPMVQAALYQLVLDRKVGEYELPEGASLIACGTPTPVRLLPCQLRLRFCSRSNPVNRAPGATSTADRTGPVHPSRSSTSARVSGCWFPELGPETASVAEPSTWYVARSPRAP